MSNASNSRASLLAGLRTGGVRSASQPSIVPHTAAPGGSFNVPRYASFSNQGIMEDETDELADMVSHNFNLNGGRRSHHPPATASAAESVGNRFERQQHQAFMHSMATQRAASLGGMNGGGVDPQALQIQMLQMEFMKLQAIQQAQQVQQYQAELMAQAQRNNRRGSMYGEPATAGPMNMSFDLRGNSGTSFGMQQIGEDYDDTHMPMTAALGGKFGSRTASSGLNPNASVFTVRPDSGDDYSNPPKTAGLGRTTVISGGTALGSVTPSKSDSALSWRKGPAPMNGRSVSGSPAVKVTPPAEDASTPAALKGRPQPLRFNGIGNGLPTISIDRPTVEIEEEIESDDSFSSEIGQIATINDSAHSDGRESSPSTPPSAGSNGSLSAREEASKRLYEGLGIGRPTQVTVPPVVVAPPARMFSQPMRQPRGPPASVDELGSRNFATRLPLKVMVGVY